jgi:hypothetical protein
MLNRKDEMYEGTSDDMTKLEKRKYEGLCIVCGEEEQQKGDLCNGCDEERRE